MNIELFIGGIVLGIIIALFLFMMIVCNYYERLLLILIFLVGTSFVLEGYNAEFVGVTIVGLMTLFLIFVRSRYFKPYLKKLEKVREHNRKIILEE